MPPRMHWEMDGANRSRLRITVKRTLQTVVGNRMENRSSLRAANTVPKQDSREQEEETVMVRVSQAMAGMEEAGVEAPVETDMEGNGTETDSGNLTDIENREERAVKEGAAMQRKTIRALGRDARFQSDWFVSSKPVD